MANRTWRVAANFTRVGDVVVTVQSPNWQSAIRKAALVIKRLPEMKGRRLNMATFMLQEVEAPVVVAGQPSEQLPLQAEVAQVEPQQQEQTQPSTTSEPDLSE